MLRELADYYRPTKLEDALQLLQQPHTVPLAGGTELLGRKDASIKAVVDLQDLGLDYVRADSDGLRIGAMTRLQTLVTNPLVCDVADGLLARCAELSAQFTERCAATIGGTIASAPSWNDLLVALLVVEAQVMAGKNLTGLGDLSGLLRTGTLITEIVIPPQPAGARFAYQRISRTPRDRATVCLALAKTREVVRVAVGGAGETAVRAPQAEQLLSGQPLTDALVTQAATQIQVEFDPPSDHIASSEYRRAMLGVLLRRALDEVRRMKDEG